MKKIIIRKVRTQTQVLEDIARIVRAGNWRNISRSGELSSGEDNKYATFAYYDHGVVVELGTSVPSYSISIYNQAGYSPTTSGKPDAPEKLQEWAKECISRRMAGCPLLFQDSWHLDNEYTLVIYDNGQTADICLPLEETLPVTA